MPNNRTSNTISALHRIKRYRLYALIIVMLGLLTGIIMGDIQKAQANLDARMSLLAKELGDLENSALQLADIYSAFMAQEPRPTREALSTFTQNLTESYEFIYMLSTIERLSKEDIETRTSADFILKELQFSLDGSPTLVRKAPGPVNFVTTFVQPVSLNSKNIIGLEVSNIPRLESLLELAPEDKPQPLGLLPQDINLGLHNKTFMDSFKLLEGGYALSLNQVSRASTTPELITSLLLSHQSIYNYLAQALLEQSLSIGFGFINDDVLWLHSSMPSSANVSTENTTQTFTDLSPSRFGQLSSTYQGKIFAAPVELRLYQSFSIPLSSSVLIIGVLVAFVIAVGFFNRLHDQIALRQDKLERANKRLSTNLAEQSDLFSYISHELNTPLTLISSPLQTLQQETQRTGQKEHIEMIAKNTARMQELVQHVLNVKAYQRLTLAPVAQNILAPINDTLAVFQPRTYDANIQLHVLSNTFDELTMTFDTTSLRMTLDNLFSNAIKYNVANGWIEVEWELTLQGFTLSVRNAQEGVTEEQCSSMFTKFVRHNKKAETAGYGLGLGLVADICERNDWQIAVQLGQKTANTELAKTELSHVGLSNSDLTKSGSVKAGRLISEYSNSESPDSENSNVDTSKFEPSKTEGIPKLTDYIEFVLTVPHKN